MSDRPEHPVPSLRHRAARPTTSRRARPSQGGRHVGREGGRPDRRRTFELLPGGGLELTDHARDELAELRTLDTLVVAEEPGVPPTRLHVEMATQAGQIDALAAEADHERNETSRRLSDQYKTVRVIDHRRSTALATLREAAAAVPEPQRRELLDLLDAAAAERRQDYRTLQDLLAGEARRQVLGWRGLAARLAAAHGDLDELAAPLAAALGPEGFNSDGLGAS